MASKVDHVYIRGGDRDWFKIVNNKEIALQKELISGRRYSFMVCPLDSSENKGICELISFEYR